MEVNDTRTLRQDIDGESAFVVAAPSISITKPDGTVVTGTAVTVDSPTSAITHTLYATYTFAQAGSYRVKWHYEVGVEVFETTETYFVYYSNVYALIRQKMGLDSTQLTDAEIDNEFTWLTRHLTAQYGLPEYYALSGTDPLFLDEGAACIVVLRMRQYKPATPSGPISRWKVQQSDITFAVKPLPEDSESIREQAARALSQVATIKAYYDGLASSLHMMHADGRTRSDRALGGLTLSSVLTRLLGTPPVSGSTDVVTYE